MGINLFVEGRPSPVLVHVRLRREVSSLAELADVAAALADIDRALRAEWPRMWPTFKPRARRDVYLVRFRVSSPPEFSVFADPAWLAVFIAIITGYDRIRNNVSLIVKDVGSIVRQVRGLTERQTQLLDIAIRLSAERFLSAGERSAERLAKRFRRAKHRLMGTAEELPEIEVVDLGNKDVQW
jgi:hypothetical protein